MEVLHWSFWGSSLVILGYFVVALGIFQRSLRRYSVGSLIDLWWYPVGKFGGVWLYSLGYFGGTLGSLLGYSEVTLWVL